MTSAAATAARSASTGTEQRRLFDPRRGEVAEGRVVRPAPRPPSGAESLTLGRGLAVAWERLLVAGAAECPVCRGRLVPAGDAARCECCRAELR